MAKMLDVLGDFEENKRRAREILQKVWRRRGRTTKPLNRRRKEEIIEQIRKTRQELWEEKLAARH